MAARPLLRRLGLGVLAGLIGILVLATFFAARPLAQARTRGSLGFALRPRLDVLLDDARAAWLAHRWQRDGLGVACDPARVMPFVRLLVPHRGRHAHLQRLVASLAETVRALDNAAHWEACLTLVVVDFDSTLSASSTSTSASTTTPTSTPTSSSVSERLEAVRSALGAWGGPVDVLLAERGVPFSRAGALEWAADLTPTPRDDTILFACDADVLFRARPLWDATSTSVGFRAARERVPGGADECGFGAVAQRELALHHARRPASPAALIRAASREHAHDMGLQRGAENGCFFVPEDGPHPRASVTDAPATTLDRLLLYTRRGESAYAPILWSTCFPEARWESVGQRPTDGWWRDGGAGMVAVFASDWDRVGGFRATGFVNQTTHGGEDVAFVARLAQAVPSVTVLRRRDPDLLHPFHPKAPWTADTADGMVLRAGSAGASTAPVVCQGFCDCQAAKKDPSG